MSRYHRKRTRRIIYTQPPIEPSKEYKSTITFMMGAMTKTIKKCKKGRKRIKWIARKNNPNNYICKLPRDIVIIIGKLIYSGFKYNLPSPTQKNYSSFFNYDSSDESDSNSDDFSWF